MVSIENKNLDNSKQIPTVKEIQDWLVAYLAELLEIEPTQIDVKISFQKYGLDSSAAIGMIGEMEDWLGYELNPTIIYDHPSIEALSLYIKDQII